MSADREKCLEAALRRAAAASSPVEVKAAESAPAQLSPSQTAPAHLPVALTAPAQLPAVPSIVYQPPNNIQMLCVSSQDLLLLMQQMTASFAANRSTAMRPALPEVPPSLVTSGPSAASTSTTPPVVPAPESVPTTDRVESPDVLLMESPPSPSSAPGNRSPSPDFSWLFNEDPPVVVESVKSPPYRSKYFNYDKASTSSKYFKYDKPCETFRRHSRSPSPPSGSPSSRSNHCGARRKERSPSPFTFRRSTYSSSSTNRHSGTDYKTTSRISRTPSPSFLGSRFPENKASTSSSLNRRSGIEDYKRTSRKSRTPSPTFLGSSFLENKASTSSSLNRRSGIEDYKRTSRRSRTPSPTFLGSSFLENKGSTSSSLHRRSGTVDYKRTSRRSRTPSPTFLASSLADKKSRHSAPEFLDFEPRARTPSPSSFLDDKSSSATSLLRSKCRKSPERKKSRSPTPNFLRDFNPDERSLSPTFSLFGKKKFSNENERSLSPDFAPHSKKPKQESDPDYKPSTSVTPPPAKKRGRPRKNTAKPKVPKAPVTCPVCKEDEAGNWVNTKCGHFSHKDCLMKWLHTPGQLSRPADAKVCPGCGQDFDPLDNNPIFFG